MSVFQTLPPRPTRVGGMRIRRLLPAATRRTVGPFIFMDQGGPSDAPAGGMGVPEHPHAGLSTFTYLMDGALRHRDSAGHEATVRAGDIALMTAGRGITHDERPDPDWRGARMPVHFAQMWLALPDALEEMPPAFELHTGDTLPIVERPGAWVKLAMGAGWGRSAPTTQHHPGHFAELSLQPGARLPLEIDDPERAVFLLEGDLAASDPTTGAVALLPHHLHLLEQTDVVLSSTHGARALLFGGAPFSSPRVMGGPFVASSPEKLNRWMHRASSGDWPRIGR